MTKAMLAVVLALGGCATLTDPTTSREYTGLYASGFEVEGFVPCGTDESWWVTEGEELRERYGEVATRPYEAVYVVVRGAVGPEGRYGHLGAYPHEIAVSDVVEIRPARPGECDGSLPATMAVHQRRETI